MNLNHGLVRTVDYQESKQVHALAMRLIAAIWRFYKNDVRSLFGVEVVDERAMVGCIYRYVWNEHKARAWSVQDIDIEYNRMKDDELVDKQKSIRGIVLEKCIRMEKCDQLRNFAIKLATEMKSITSDGLLRIFRPDLIIHNRGNNGIANNGLIVEFKKEKEKGVNSEDAKLDHAKLLFMTCHQAGCMQFKLGALVMLREEYADVGVYRGGKVIVGYKVDESGFRKMTEEEYGGKPWLNQKKAMQ